MGLEPAGGTRTPNPLLTRLSARSPLHQADLQKHQHARAARKVRAIHVRSESARVTANGRWIALRLYAQRRNLPVWADDLVTLAVEVLRVLADPTRLQLAGLLLDADQSVSQMAAVLHKPPAAMDPPSRHMRGCITAPQQPLRSTTGLCGRRVCVGSDLRPPDRSGQCPPVTVLHASCRPPVPSIRHGSGSAARPSALVLLPSRLSVEPQ